MRLSTTLFAILFVGAPAWAGDWPQWLGPNRDGNSIETIGVWKDAPKIVWRKPVGEGHSSPIVADGKVFLLHRVPNKNAEQLTVWNARTGEPLSTIQYDRPQYSNPFGAGPRATPIYHGGAVYSIGVTGLLLKATVAADGQMKQVFLIDILKEFQAKNLFFGVSASLLIDNGNLLLMTGGKGAGVVSLSCRDGSVNWKVSDDGASYASPIVVGEGSNRNAVFLTQKGLSGLAPKDGKVIWNYPFKDALSESSTTPVQIGQHLLASSVTLGSVLLKFTTKDNSPSVEKVWHNKELNCYFSTPAIVGDHVYMVTAGGNFAQPKLMLRCVEIATGNTLWSKPDVGRFHAALLRTGNNRLLMLDDRGKLTLIQPEPKEYRELATAKVCGQTWAHPALADGLLYLRDDKEILCIEMPK
jgi:outer membrane protein assembly factor BamB